MIKRFSFFILLSLAALNAFAQTDTVTNTPPKTSGLRISLLTCGTGYEQVYEIFGHTALRVVDSNEHGPLGDLVYNYGMFGYDEQFEMKFMRGKLLYYVATNLYGDFMQEYLHYGRSVEEQVLMIDDATKAEINNFLKTNVLPENRYYKYDFFFDNCATRLRDVFPRALGKDFVYGEARPQGVALTFRDIINQYFYARHWERVGVNILLGSRIDKVMTNEDIMFLPDYLRDGVAGAKLRGQQFATRAKVLLPGGEKPPAGTNWALVLTGTILALTIAGHAVKRLAMLGRIMRFLVLFVTGLLGCIICVMWFGTDHQGCSNNFNLLWAVPLNLFIAFANPKGKGKYAMIGALMVLVSVVLHVVHIQGLVPELFLLLLSLLIVYGSIYRRHA